MFDKIPQKEIKMKKYLSVRISLLVSLMLAAAIMLSSCSDTLMSYDSFAMGSVLNVKLYAADEKAAAVYEDINSEINKLDKAISATDENSEISQINQKGISKVSPETLKLIEDIMTISHICHKKLDITIGAVSSLWKFNTDSPVLPDKKELAKAVKAVDLDKILVDEQMSSVKIEEGQQLDLGAFGKGAALDRAARVLEDKDISAILTFGGAVMINGNNPTAKNWKIGIRDPFKTDNDTFGTLTFDNKGITEPLFISTSGAYEKSFTENGKIYHHILSTETGYPAESELAAVTVVSHTGLSSDALSTFCFIQGLNDDTLATLENFESDAVFIFNDNTYYVTEGLKEAFTLSADSASLKTYEK